MGQATVFPTLFDLMGLRWAPAVVDLDALRTRNAEFVVRNRRRDLENHVYDFATSKVDEFLRIPPAERRTDLYRTQETVPYVHPNGYRGPGLNLRDGTLREGYDPRPFYPDTRYIPNESKEGVPGQPGFPPMMPGGAIIGPPPPGYPPLPPGGHPGTGPIDPRYLPDPRQPGYGPPPVGDPPGSSLGMPRRAPQELWQAPPPNSTLNPNPALQPSPGRAGEYYPGQSGIGNPPTAVPASPVGPPANGYLPLPPGGHPNTGPVDPRLIPDPQQPSYAPPPVGDPQGPSLPGMPRREPQDKWQAPPPKPTLNPNPALQPSPGRVGEYYPGRSGIGNPPPPVPGSSSGAPLRPLPNTNGRTVGPSPTDGPVLLPPLGSTPGK